MIAAADLAHCTEAIRHGSRSFYAASRLLPSRVRDPALALYAFCRLADDAVDLQQQKADAVMELQDRLNLAYEGRPRNAPADRAFAAMIEAVDMPRALPEALLEGLAWDALERRYASLSELRAYSARVASAVGAMMCVLMGVRDRGALARACDLGVAMQLTNISRDIGEDAREGRLYLPLDWLEQAGLDPEALLADPAPRPEIRTMVRRLLNEASILYARSEAGVRLLPIAARPGIFAARYIYAGIGGRIAAAGHDSITRRAHTGGAQKLGWTLLALGRSAGTLVMPRSPLLYARPLPETAFLVDAAATQAPPATDWSDTLYATLARAKAHEQERRGLLMKEARRAS
ncbi:MAG: 15-cis-phytoene synthase [Paracoccaceae bacterium]